MKISCLEAILFFLSTQFILIKLIQTIAVELE